MKSAPAFDNFVGMTTQTKFSLSITQPGYMEEAPEATFITVQGDEAIAKRVFASELIVTGQATGEEADAQAAATDLGDHPLSTPFGLELGGWTCVARAES